MDKVIAKNIQGPEKSKFLYGNEKMNEEQDKDIESTETTNDNRRVTANTPAYTLTRHFLLAFPEDLRAIYFSDKLKA